MRFLAPHRIRAVVELLAIFVVDVVRSNAAVALVVLRPGTGARTAGMLSMPLEVRHPAALAAMACIITATPGTCWVRYDAVSSVLAIHMLELVDPQAWIRLFKRRYEQRLKEIFE
jgi:multicomponent K+:H+ antiporter subunit E